VPAAARWPQIATLICIESTRTDTTSNKATTETRYYISSRRLDPAAANRAVRAHWEIENSLHHVLDVTFGQDANRTRTKNAPTNLNLVRNFALNAVRAYDGDKKSMPRRRRMCGYELPYREAVLASIARR
jgi:predicted transposase YbfD/YdcC